MKFENKIVARLTGTLFFLILCALCFVTLLRHSDEYSFFENRNLKKMPERESDSILNGKYFTELEGYLADHAAGRTTLVRINAALELAIGKPVVNDVVVTDDVLLPFNRFEGAPDNESISHLADIEATNLARHKASVESYGGRFCYVAVPCQYVCLADKYPWYLENRAEYTEASSSALFSSLDKVGVEYIDMLSVYEGFSDEKKAQFTSTIDNHYSILGAYETYLKMIGVINGEWGGSVEALTEDGFEVSAVPNRYLGSRNRKLFNLWSNGEQLFCIYPKNDLPFRRFNSDIEGAASVYSIPSDPYEFATYTVYMNGDMPRASIDTERRELPSILIYGDSFTNAVECVAWYSFDRMYTLDFRYYNDMTLDEFVLEKKPDYVFCIRDYEALLDLTSNGK